MVRPEDFLRTIYLGDRGCKSLLIDGWGGRVVMQATVVSRVRSPTGHWDYYTDEDIPDGLLVFSGVTSFGITPPGLIPNDLINSVEVEPAAGGAGDSVPPQLFRFKISVDCVDAAGRHAEVQIQLEAEGVHLEDPRQPGVVIH